MQKLKHHEPIAGYRRDLAAFLRRLRKDIPPMARLFYLRMKAAERELMDEITSGKIG